MKIVFNCLSMEKGGAERVIATLANKFIVENEVTIITLINSDIRYELDKRIKIMPIDNKDFFKQKKLKKILIKLSFKRLTKLAKIIKKENPDVIISFLPEPSMRLMLIKKFSKTIKKIPTIISIRNNPITEYKNKIIYFVMKHLYKEVDGLVLQTEEAKKYFEDIIKDEKKLKIISNPINEKFVLENTYTREREKTIITVGRIEEQKNQRLLIDAFKEVVKKHDDYKLLIYGKGKLKDELQQYIKEINITDKVIFKGQVDNIKEEILKAGIFVLSSNYEGMPNALMEAMALGLPCVSTDCPCGGPKTLIKNKDNGILVEVNNIEEMIQAINFLIENGETAKKIGESASKIKENYSIDIIYREWISMVQKVRKI